MYLACFLLPPLVLKYYQGTSLYSVSAKICPTSTTNCLNPNSLCTELLLPHVFDCVMASAAFLLSLCLFSFHLTSLPTTYFLFMYHILISKERESKWFRELNIDSIFWFCYALYLLSNSKECRSTVLRAWDTPDSNSYGQGQLVYVVSIRGSHSTEHGHLCWKKIYQRSVSWMN